MSVTAGPYVQGEKPADLVYQFLDSSGVAIDLTGYTGFKFQFQEHDGSATVATAVLLDAPTGKVAYTFTGVEFTTPGRYRAQFWAGNGVHRLASVDIFFDVAAPVGPIPAI